LALTLRFMLRIPSPREDTPIRAQNDSRVEALKDAMLAKGERVFGYLCVLTRGDKALAEELAMETWLKVFNRFKIENFKTRGLLFRKAKQVFVSRMRKAITRSFVEFRTEMDDLPTGLAPRDNVDNPSKSAGWDEFWANFEPRTFDPMDMKCFWLLYRYDFTINEISSRVSLPESTVYDRVSKLVHTCRKILISRKR